jgi:hypothetical protein
MMIRTATLIVLALVVFMGGCAGVAPNGSTQTMTETDLYFGMSKSTGGTVSPEEWTTFVTDVVSPRFPDGLTIEDGQGEWRGADQKVTWEKTRVIVLVYVSTSKKEKAIEEIRDEYKKREQQESVMKVSHPVSVSF